MADITMCSGLECPFREKCYRVTAKKNLYWQAYFDNPPYDHDTGECNYYWDNKEYNKSVDGTESR